MNNVKRILLAEDNPNDVELTLMALAEHNLANEVIVAQDGEEALDYLYRRGQYASYQNGNPVVVLLDIKMPKVDGLEVLRQIKSDPALQTIPVVILTSSREDKDLVESYKLGVNAYVVKPVDFHEFVDAIREIGLFWGIINAAPPAGAPTLTSR
jgi:CheY-like chemotaxis protein